MYVVYLVCSLACVSTACSLSQCVHPAARGLVSLHAHMDFVTDDPLLSKDGVRCDYLVKYVTQLHARWLHIRSWREGRIISWVYG